MPIGNTDSEIFISGFFLQGICQGSDNGGVLVNAMDPFTYNNLSGRSIHFGNNIYNVITSSDETHIYLAYSMDEFPSEGTQFQVSYIITDLTDVSAEFGICYVCTKNLQVSGFLYLNNTSILFDDCRVFVYGSGILQCGDLVSNSLNEPLRTKGIKMTFTGVNGSYGRDNWRSDSTPGIVNDDATLILAQADVLINTPTRSDFDFTENTTVMIVNSILSGHATSYHHLNSNNMSINNFSVYDATSIELQKSPVFMKGMRSINCQYGLSFYPTNATLEAPVYIYDLDIINPVEYMIKRNTLSGLVLVNPMLRDFDNITTNGIAPLKVHFTTTDNITDQTAEPVRNAMVNYFHSKTTTTIDQDQLLRLPQTALFTYVTPENTIYLTDTEKGFVGGETLTIDNIDNDLIFTNEAITKTYVDPIIYVKSTRISNNDGSLDPVQIPYGYIARGEVEFRLFDPPVKHIVHNGDEYIFPFASTRDQRDIIVLTPQAQPENPQITELKQLLTNTHTDTVTTLTSIQNQIDNLELKGLQDILTSPNESYYYVNSLWRIYTPPDKTHLVFEYNENGTWSRTFPYITP